MYQPRTRLTFFLFSGDSETGGGQKTLTSLVSQKQGDSFSPERRPGGQFWMALLGPAQPGISLNSWKRNP
jgi:hypothetical protein